MATGTGWWAMSKCSPARTAARIQRLAFRWKGT